jgi:hypothetical protein
MSPELILETINFKLYKYEDWEIEFWDKDLDGLWEFIAYRISSCGDRLCWRKYESFEKAFEDAIYTIDDNNRPGV